MDNDTKESEASDPVTELMARTATQYAAYEELRELTSARPILDVYGSTEPDPEAFIVRDMDYPVGLVLDID